MAWRIGRSLEWDATLFHGLRSVANKSRNHYDISLLAKEGGPITLFLPLMFNLWRVWFFHQVMAPNGVCWQRSFPSTFLFSLACQYHILIKQPSLIYLCSSWKTRGFAIQCQLLRAVKSSVPTNDGVVIIPTVSSQPEILRTRDSQLTTGLVIRACSSSLICDSVRLSTAPCPDTDTEPLSWGHEPSPQTNSS